MGRVGVVSYPRFADTPIRRHADTFPIGGGVVPSNPTIRITAVPSPISQRTFLTSDRKAVFSAT